MKPITHPLAIDLVHAFAGTSLVDLDEAMARFKEAGCPLYADPTPLPAPALWMRVFAEAPLGISKLAQTADFDAIADGVTWPALMRRYFRTDAVVVMITDSRTGDVLWRRA